MLAGGQCGVRCGPGYFRQNSSHCSPCHPSCHSCVGPGDTDCALCEAPSLYFSRCCVPYCPAGHTASADSAQSLTCPLGCDSCARPDRCSPAPQAGRPRTTQGSARLPLPSSASPASTEGAGPAWPVTPPAGPARGTERRTAPGATQTTNSSGQPAVLPVLQVRALHHSTLYPLYRVVRLLPIRPGKLLYQLPALLPDL